jgi:hypothetical protein
MLFISVDQRVTSELKRGSTIAIRHLFMDRTLFGPQAFGFFYFSFNYLILILKCLANLKQFMADSLGKPYETEILQIIRVCHFKYLIIYIYFTLSRIKICLISKIQLLKIFV